MHQQQPSSILWQRLALRARSRIALRALLAARILGPKCRASAEESAAFEHLGLRSFQFSPSPNASFIRGRCFKEEMR